MDEHAKDTLLKQKIEHVTSRHVGRLMERLEEADVPGIVRDAVKKEFWLMCDDCKCAVEERNNI